MVRPEDLYSAIFSIFSSYLTWSITNKILTFLICVYVGATDLIRLFSYFCYTPKTSFLVKTFRYLKSHIGYKISCKRTNCWFKKCVRCRPSKFCHFFPFSANRRDCRNKNFARRDFECWLLGFYKIGLKLTGIPKHEKSGSVTTQLYKSWMF